MKKILNVAHRGLSGLYPENTMIAFRKAIEADCDGIEMDVHLTRDGVPVVIHDEEVDRTTNGSGYVKDFTYEQLCNFCLLYTSLKIILKKLKPHFRLNIDINFKKCYI